MPTIIAGLMVLTSCSTTEASKSSTTATASTAPATDSGPCAGPHGVGGPVPAGLGPGDLVAAADLTPANQTSPGFPTGARIWRILYVSTGVDEGDLQLICGLVAAPTAGPALFGDHGRLLNWTHGTVGVAQECLPSSDPANMFWGKMAGGINAVAWGSDLGKHEGDPAGGLLQYAMNQGLVVTATDYQPNDTYVVGKMEASDALDAARAGTQLMSKDFRTAPSAYDMFIWGHSQGGHAALWAGQLAESYLAATKPSAPTARLNLIGVAALAPASNFITLPGQTGTAAGDGLADWEMHQNIGLDLPIETLQMQIGPALFSYIFGSWQQLAAGRPPTSTAKFPAFPADATKLDLTAIATADPGAGTVGTVQPLCLTGNAAKQVQKAVSSYYNAHTNQMLVPAVWNLPAGYKPGQYFKGGLDSSCLAGVTPGLTAWCSWMRWNLPGPLGTNPYPTVPMVAGVPVPLLIAQGMNDDIIHCIAPSGSEGAVPEPADCMSRALYDSLATTAYCPASVAKAQLSLDTFRHVDLESPGTHFSVPGQISAKGGSKSAADLVFTGSPLQLFMSAAFDRTTVAGCSTQVINPG